MVERVEVMFLFLSRHLVGWMGKEGGVGFYAGFQVCLGE